MVLRSHYAREIALMGDPSARNVPESVSVAGWVHETRSLGKVAFIILRDRTGLVQVTLRPERVGEDAFSSLTALPRESVIAVQGEPVRSPRAKVGAEILAERVDILTVSESPLPLGVADRVQAEMETRLNHRAVDLRKPEVLRVFLVRDALLRSIQEFMRSEGFIEVHTPKLVSAGAEGGATLFPVEYFERRAYLAQSPQLYKQSLMSSGFDRVFEVSAAFRAEPFDTTRHVTEFSSFDAELAFISGMEDVLDVLERCMHAAITSITERFGLDPGLTPFPPIPRVEYSDAVDMLAESGKHIPPGEDLDTEGEKMLGDIMREKGAPWYYITGYPETAKPFYIMEAGERSESFDLSFGGREIASGGQREHRYGHLVERMVKKGLDPKKFGFYLEPFRFGMPPHGGWGLGVDRLNAGLLGLGNLREAILFPRDRVRLVP